MYTIVDYLKYYKDSNFDEVGFNVMDNLLFSILVYLPIESFDKVKSFDEFWNYETLKEELESNFSKYFIAKQNDNIVGFAGLKIILDEADLMNIVTKKCCRHEGIASNIMDKLIEYCKQEKIKCINLEVSIQNSIAINFYKKYNFKEVGLRKKYYDNTYDAILMKLEF